MSIILENDILYNILSYIDLPTIGNIICVNKTINKLCCAKHFWKKKFYNNYNYVISKSDDWVHEYKRVHSSHKMAIKFVKNFSEMRHTYPQLHNYHFNKININDNITPFDLRKLNDHIIKCGLCWLPEKIVNKINEFESLDHNVMKSSMDFEIYSHEDGTTDFAAMFDIDPVVYQYSIYMINRATAKITKEMFITGITVLSYNYEDLILCDTYNNEFLFLDELVVHMNEKST